MACGFASLVFKLHTSNESLSLNDGVASRVRAEAAGAAIGDSDTEVSPYPGVQEIHNVRTEANASEDARLCTVKAIYLCLAILV